MLKDFNRDTQKLFLSYMVSKPDLYTRVTNIVNPENFTKDLREIVEFIQEYDKKYTSMPSVEEIQAVTGQELINFPVLEQSRCDWFLDNFEAFTRRQELERAILKSADLLEKGNYDPVEKLIKDAVQISLTRDMGTNYFMDPRARLNRLKSSNGQISTGWPQLDKLLYGGFNRGELQIFAGGSGSGKSLVMMNLSANWLQQKLNGVYITLELSEDLSSMRVDTMLTGVPTRELFKKLDDVELKLGMLGKTSGKFQIKYLPAQSTVNDIRAYIKEFELSSGHRVDFVCIDYLDLLMPVSAKVSPSDLFVKDKYVSEEVRNLAKELNVLLVTASQLNRSAVEEIEFDHSHISGGISKINTADNVFGIFTSRSMKERGQYQIQCMKTRSSNGVGQKIDLHYDIDTMRITDDSDPDEYKSGGSRQAPAPTGNQLLDKIKTQSTVVKPEAKPGFDITAPQGAIPDDVKKVTADVQSTKLKTLLSAIKR